MIVVKEVIYRLDPRRTCNYIEIATNSAYGNNCRKDPQRKLPRGNFNLRESLSQKNIANDLIYVEVLIQVNIASDVARDFQHRR